MKINHSHFIVESRKMSFKPAVLDKYKDLKDRAEALNEEDAYWLKVFEAELQKELYEVVVTHTPTNFKFKWQQLTPADFNVLNKDEYIDKMIKMIKEKRLENRQIKGVSKTFEESPYETIGGVFKSSGLIKEIGKKIKANDPTKAKKPRWPKKNYVGVELEFNDNHEYEQDQIVDAMIDAGYGKYVHVGTDGSCGWEVRVLVLEEEVDTVLVGILKLLQSMGFKTDKRCGTHVHIDMRNRDVKHCYANLFKAQSFLRKFLNDQRKRNGYTVKNDKSTFDESLKQGRRNSINCQAYGEHKTLEVRMHQGTLKETELVPWIKLLIKIVNYDKEFKAKILTLKQATNELSLDKDLFDQLKSRLGELVKEKAVV